MQCQPMSCSHLQGEKEAIHSGHFMVSDFEAEAQDDEYEVAVPVPEPAPLPADLQQGAQINPKLQIVTAGQLAIETSLSKLFQCMSLAYRQKLTSPKWNRFKGIRLRWKDKIRLNNVIWRCWHMQFIKRENTLICQFASPLDEGIHNKPEAVVLEGKYWKRKLAAVTAEYKKWRMFYRNKIMGWPGKDYSLVDPDLMDWPSQHHDSQEGFNNQMMVDEDYMELMSDTLFSTISSNQPFAFPDIREIARGASLADFIQPSLVQLQPNLDDFMDTIEPLQEFFSSRLPPVPEDCAVSDAAYRGEMAAAAVRTDDPMDFQYQDSKVYRPEEEDGPAQKVGKLGYQPVADLKTSRMYLSEKKQAELYKLAQDAAEGYGGHPVAVPYSDAAKPRPYQSAIQTTTVIGYTDKGRSYTQVNPAAYVVKKEPHFAAGPSYIEARGRSYSAPDSQSMGLYGPEQKTYPSPPPSHTVAYTDGVRGLPSVINSPVSATYKVAAPPAATSAHFGFQPTVAIPQQVQFSRTQQTYDLASSVPDQPLPLKTVERSSSLPSVAKEEVFAVPKVQLKSRHRSRSGSSLLSNKSRGHPPPLVSSNSDPNLNVQKSALLAQLLTVTAQPGMYVTPIATVTASPAGSSKSAHVPILPMPPQQNAGQMLIATLPQTQTYITTIRAPSSPESSGEPGRSPGVTSPPATSPLLNDPLSPRRTSDVPERNKTPPIPDHRRACHINAEQKRRYNIRNGFDMLHSLIPHLQLNPNVKLSKAAMLQKGAEYIRQLQAERAQVKEEMESLRQQIDCLNAAISNCQSMLPATGAPVSRHRTDKMRDMYEQWVRIRTQENWRFWVFSQLIEPLLGSFNCSVSTASYQDLYRSTLMWVEQHCSLVNLRPAVLNSLRNLSTTTDVLTDPQKLPEIARAAISKKDPQNRS